MNKAQQLLSICESSFTDHEKWKHYSEAEAWSNLPKGWTEDSVKSFWKSLTGSKEHKVTACIAKMEKAGMEDPGAFCGSLASKLGER